jgi:hypothetical protein
LFESKDKGKFVPEIFFRNLEQIKFKRPCQDLVQNRFRKVLLEACKTSGNNKGKDIVEYLHRRLKREIDFSKLGNWDEIIFENEKHNSVKEVLIEATSKEYQRGLKNIILKLKKFDSLGSAFVLHWTPEPIQNELFLLFKENCDVIFKKLQ